MRLDSGNRSFAALLTASVALFALLGAGSCALLMLLLYRWVTEGGSAFSHDWAIAPALLFLVVNAAGPLLGLRSLGRQIASSRRLRRRVARLARRPSEQLRDLARATGLGRRLRVIESGEPFSFAYGAWRPRVVVSQGLVDCTSEDELRAVLVHERYHVRNLDPLKLVVARAFAATFFLIPALRALERRYLASRELAADRRALRDCGRHPLAGALLKVVRGPEWPELATAAAVGGPELLDIRVAQLESGREPPAPLSRAMLILSALALAVLLASFVSAVVGLGGFEALFAMSHDQLDESGLGPVLCLGSAIPYAVAGWLGLRWHRA
jgi:Zn-dependent protease with chaperone function